ncbi:BTB/POZ domain-containing protein, partial [Trifolium medium]|nr:BTB/POZ domain-containing protein [Trifolium medium]
KDLKSSAQEQLEYMLTEDDDAPLLIADDNIKFEILSKLEIMGDFVECWFDASENIVKALEQRSSTNEVVEVKLRAIEVTSKVLEAIAYGTVILPTAKRLQVLKVWLPFVRVTKPIIDSSMMDCENAVLLKMDGEMWQSLESSFVSIILALPSGDQAELLTQWLENEHIRYPDLTEA